MQKLNYANKKQKGAVLILIAFIIGLATAAYLLHAFDPARLRLEQDKKTMQSLNEAKQALIAWAVSHPNTPGLMPYPDRNGDGNYDDTADCYISTVNFNPIFTLGRLPLFRNDPFCITNDTIDTSGVHDTQVINGLSADLRDGTGERLWYEVSSNLLHDYKSSAVHSNGASPVINPSIINNLTWFVVRDRNGLIISDRVAAVIIAPGAPSGAQDRTGGIANANQYLDKIVMADGIPYQNYGYQNPATNPVQEFIIGDDFRMVAKNDPTYKDQAIEPYYYNDKLVYITIDELMAALEKRVGEQVRANLTAYATANAGAYPFAAKLGSSKFYACQTNNLTGFLPVTNPAPTSATCNYTRAGSNVAADCGAGGFGEVASIFFRKTLTNFTASAGGCTFSGRDCSCRGAGSCTRGAQIFQCDANANCDTAGTTAGEVRFIGGEFDAATMAGTCNVPTAGNTCQESAVDVRCTGIGAGSVTRNICTDPVFNTGTSQLPAWFTANRWQDYVYYEMTRPTNMDSIAVGNRKVGAMVATMGRPIKSVPLAFKGSQQLRPSCNVNDYLDSAENISVNSLYDATSKKRANNYNDQTFTVAP